MELLNYIRYKESGVIPSVKNSSKNCALNIIEMEMVLTRMNKQVDSVLDVEDSMFKFAVKLENDDSHFEGVSFGQTPQPASKQSVNLKKPLTVGKHYFPQSKPTLTSKPQPNSLPDQSPPPVARLLGAAGGPTKGPASVGIANNKKK